MMSFFGTLQPDLAEHCAICARVARLAERALIERPSASHSALRTLAHLQPGPIPSADHVAAPPPCWKAQAASGQKPEPSSMTPIVHSILGN